MLQDVQQWRCKFNFADLEGNPRRRSRSIHLYWGARKSSSKSTAINILKEENSVKSIHFTFWNGAKMLPTPCAVISLRNVT